MFRPKHGKKGLNSFHLINMKISLYIVLLYEKLMVKVPNIKLKKKTTPSFKKKVSV